MNFSLTSFSILIIFIDLSKIVNHLKHGQQALGIVIKEQEKCQAWIGIKYPPHFFFPHIPDNKDRIIREGYGGSPQGMSSMVAKIKSNAAYLVWSTINLFSFDKRIHNMRIGKWCLTEKE